MQAGGKQTDWQAVRETTDLPIITIITSTFNAVADLPWTIKSVKNQTYPNIQWIVADGASKDNTVEMLRDNSDVIDYWFSEPDTGIYDAWNKALKHVEGDWVQFLGAGDELYETTTLEQVAEYLKGAYPQYNIAYGKILYISEKNRKPIHTEGEDWEYYHHRWGGNQKALPPHPAVFHHQTIFNTLQYDTQFKIIADYHLLVQQVSKPFLYIPIIVDRMLKGGVSSTPKGMVKCYEELAISNDLLGFRPPFKHGIKRYVRYQLDKYCLKLISEKNYGKALDFARTLKGKPKIFDID